MKDPYIVLGMEPDAPETELTARYGELKARYSEERFLPGDAGNEAAEKLSELETAWVLVQGNLDKRRQEAQFGGDFGYTDSLIREGRYLDAQNQLDAMTNRSAEWHYFQSIVFYKREWISDAKAQLELAVNMDPYNQKYRTALDRMKLIDGNPNVPPDTLGTPPHVQQPYPQEDPANRCMNCCMMYMCMDCLCSMTRCC